MAYPGDSYYDPKRPSWLPYWIDTPTESAGKYAWTAQAVGITKAPVTAGQVVGTAYPSPAQPPAVGAPGQLTTAPANGSQAEQTIDELLREQAAAWRAANDEVFAAIPDSDSTSALWLCIAGGAVILLLFVRPK